ncbi:unnamed protein product [Peronospora destructor]|uniref:Uncharacterized protein n=1 Tax=Peronospora destructor TaxID=86335 RepID=A0AAV0UUW2_9STRA|nr:unnamed protein product [Peronospora destructor]
MRQRMSTNAVAHMRRVHPDEFIAIADHNLRKRNALVEKKQGGKTEETLPKKKKLKFETKEKTITSRTDEVKPNEGPSTTELISAGRKCTMDRTAGLIKKWLLSSGLSISVLQDEAFQHFMKQSMSGVFVLPTTVELKNQVQDEFINFAKLLKPYLAAEWQAAMGLPFLCLRQEFRPIGRKTTDDEVVNQEKAFFSLAIGFIDSQWRRVDFVLAAKEVDRDWNKQVKQLVTQTVSKTYDIQSILDYARFQVTVDDDLPSSVAAGEKHEVSTDKEEDLLTRSLRRCVIDALGVGPGSSFGIETNVCRILRLLQELVRFFELPDRAHAPAEVDAAHDTHLSLCLTSSIEDLAYATSTSFRAVANLLKASCAQFSVYWSYFNSAVRSTATEPQLEKAWTQLTMEDWHTVAEIEAILNHLGQFRLEDRVAPRLGAVAPSYAMLFRRLLSVTTNASSFKCYSMDELAVASSPAKSAARRKAKRVDTFTSTGRQCILQLRQLIAQNFTSPSTPLAVHDEIKAMLLDPRISSKVANLVTDTHAFHCAQEALRQEHRAAFELLATRNGNGSPSADDETEDDDDDDDDEISALLMVDGPKNQPPAASSTTITGRRSGDAVAEDEARAWQEWQKVYVAWDTLAHNGADLFDKGQYNLLKLYHHVDILKWFRDVGQQAHPAASLLARIYLGQQPPPFRALGSSLLRFRMQEGADWVAEAAERAEKRCMLHHNWHQYQQLSASTTLLAVNDENVNTRTF